MRKKNPVAKHINRFNRPATHKDKKKAMKRGDEKHKKLSREYSVKENVKSADKKPQMFTDPNGKRRVRMVPVDNDIIKKEDAHQIGEKLTISDTPGERVKDFRTSDAPQFKGKSDKKKQKMAIAAYLSKKDQKESTMSDDKPKMTFFEMRKSFAGGVVHDSGWKKRTDVKKDEYGNVIKDKNRAKSLAKKGARSVANEEVEPIEELKKSTYSNYIKKAVGSARASSTLAKDFDNQSYRHLKKMNRHSPNITGYTDKQGKEKAKSPEKRAKAKASYDTLQGMSKDFQRQSNNRVKGIRRAADRLAKEGFEGDNE